MIHKTGHRIMGILKLNFLSIIMNLSSNLSLVSHVLNIPQLKLDLSQGQEFGGGIDNRAGAFVMYNCARLATLNKHFEDNVSKGMFIFFSIYQISLNCFPYIVYWC